MAIFVLNGWLAGIGNTRAIMVVALAMNLFNIAGNWALIEGHWGLPRLEERGAALSSTLGSLLGAALLLAHVARTRAVVGENPLRNWKVNWSMMGRIARLSGPSLIHSACTFTGFTVFLAVIVPRTREGAAGVAASGIVWTSTSLAFFLSFGLGIAAATLMGQSLGRGDVARARRGVWISAGVGLALVLPVMIACVFAGGAVASLFTPDPEVIRLARVLFLIVASFQLFDNFGIILTEAFKGAGMTLFVMLVEVPLNLGLFLGLSVWWGVGLGWGVVGAWAPMVVYVIIYDAVMVTAFHAGLWRRGRA
jgi:Na+-driven multidrug efflux pump